MHPLPSNTLTGDLPLSPQLNVYNFFKIKNRVPWEVLAIQKWLKETAAMGHGSLRESVSVPPHLTH